MNMVLSPLPALVKRAADDRAARVIAKEQSRHQGAKPEPKSKPEESKQEESASVEPVEPVEPTKDVDVAAETTSANADE